MLARTLLFGVALIACCGGLQGTLLGIRATMEGFSLDAIGLVMSAYSMGFLLGAWLVPRSVRQVGHIRVFAALASVASVTILLHSVYVEPAWWFLFRLLTGFCFSGLYLVAESWLNAISTNSNRGRLLAAYMFVVALGFIAGQFTVSLWSPGGFEPFILASVILSIAMIPVLLSAIAAPPIEVTERLQLKRFIRTSPLGAAAVFVQGMTFGALMWLTAVFGRSIGHSVTDSSILVGMLMAGGLAVLLPIGKLSDLRDRRLIVLVLFGRRRGGPMPAGSLGRRPARRLAVGPGAVCARRRRAALVLGVHLLHQRPSRQPANPLRQWRHHFDQRPWRHVGVVIGCANDESVWTGQPLLFRGAAERRLGRLHAPPHAGARPRSRKRPDGTDAGGHADLPSHCRQCDGRGGLR